MGVDHLLGTEREEGESGLADPTMFAISATLCLATAALLFGWVVPRTLHAGPDRAAIVGAICSGVSIFPGIAFVWVGFPLVLAGAGVALGLEGRRGRHRLLSLVAIGLGALVIAAVAVGYAVAVVD